MRQTDCAGNPIGLPLMASQTNIPIEIGLQGEVIVGVLQLQRFRSGSEL
jgi:hypothetical protein